MDAVPFNIKLPLKVRSWFNVLRYDAVSAYEEDKTKDAVVAIPCNDPINDPVNYPVLYDDVKLLKFVDDNTGTLFTNKEPETLTLPENIVLPVTCKLLKLPESMYNVGIYNYFFFL